MKPRGHRLQGGSATNPRAGRTGWCPLIRSGAKYARPAMTSRRRQGIAVVTAVSLVVLLVAGGAFALSRRGAHGSSPGTAFSSTTTTNPYAAREAAAVLAAEGAVNLPLASVSGATVPRLAKRPYRHPLGSHEVVGFVPYYELGSLAGTHLAAFTYLVYFALQVRADATLVESSTSGGWRSLQDGRASGLLTTARAGGDRVLLSVFADRQSVLQGLCSQPVTAARRLADSLAPLLSRYGFAGVDLDLEGRNPSDRSGFTAFVTALSGRLRAIDPSWNLMLNVFPQSAEYPGGIFDLQALAPSVNELFVMAYDMNSTEVPSPSAPLFGSGLSDAAALATYSAEGLAAKVILGVPFYGYDFPALGPLVGEPAYGQPYAVTYDDIVASITDNGHKPRWDPYSDTPFISFKRAGRWHQTWYDDPASIALKVALAAQFHVAGVGAWELGMVEGQPKMISVLAGGSPVVKLPLPHQP